MGDDPQRARTPADLTAGRSRPHRPRRAGGRRARRGRRRRGGARRPSALASMIERYALPEMAAVWADTTRMGRWLEIELLATEAHAELGVAPVAAAKECRERAPIVDGDVRRRGCGAGAHHRPRRGRVCRRRAGPHRAARGSVDPLRVDVVRHRRHRAVLGDAGCRRPAHLGLGRAPRDARPAGACTHRDDDDRANPWNPRRADDVRRQGRPVGAPGGPGPHAPTRGARGGAVCKLSGAVGTYSNVDPAVEAHVGAALGLRPVPATQVIARDRHAEFLWACAAAAATCETVAVELRHLQRTEVAEVREGFKPGQKGSSAMPHKRNPISAETISGLARVVRSNLQAGLQDVALWHERDISHSSVERIVLPDSALLSHYMIHRLNRLLSGFRSTATGCSPICGPRTAWCSANRSFSPW